MPKVVAIRRYPVKSMGGEALASVALDSRGLVGDRGFAVVDEEGRFASGKNTRRMVRRDGIFAFSARTLPDAVVGSSAVVASSPNGEWAVGDPALDAELSRALDAPVRVLAESTTPHFDDGAVSLIGTATLDWCRREFGADADARRLRANLLVETTEPFEEEHWENQVTIGDVVLAPAGRIERCRTIDLDQDGVGSNTRWLQPLGRQRDTRVAIYLDVVTQGELAVGQDLQT